MSNHIYRIDKFGVPQAARAEFLQRVEETHAILQGCEGFVRDEIFEQCEGNEPFNLITYVEWTGMEAVEAARRTIQATHKQAGFDPRSFMAELGITMDLGLYRSIA